MSRGSWVRISPLFTFSFSLFNNYVYEPPNVLLTFNPPYLPRTSKSYRWNSVLPIHFMLYKNNWKNIPDQQMKVNNLWCQCCHHPLLWKMITDCTLFSRCICRLNFFNQSSLTITTVNKLYLGIRFVPHGSEESSRSSSWWVPHVYPLLTHFEAMV